MRVGLILSDLSLNLGLGMYYMDHRDTFMGQFMLRCPVAISPFIFLLELLCVYLYYRYGSKKKNQHFFPFIKKKYILLNNQTISFKKLIKQLRKKRKKLNYWLLSFQLKIKILNK